MLGGLWDDSWEGTNADWTRAITWHSGVRGAKLRAVAFGPEERRGGREIARSVKVDRPL